MIPQLDFDYLSRTASARDKKRLVVSWYKQDSERLHLPTRQVVFCFSSLDMQISQRTIQRARKVCQSTQSFTKSDTLKHWFRQNDFYLDKPISIIKDSLLSCGITADYKTIKKVKLNLLQG